MGPGPRALASDQFAADGAVPLTLSEGAPHPINIRIDWSESINGLSFTALGSTRYLTLPSNSPDFTWTPGMRYERDGFSGKSVVAPRLLLSWQPDAVTRVITEAARCTYGSAAD